MNDKSIEEMKSAIEADLAKRSARIGAWGGEDSIRGMYTKLPTAQPQDAPKSDRREAFEQSACEEYLREIGEFSPELVTAPAPQAQDAGVDGKDGNNHVREGAEMIDPPAQDAVEEPIVPLIVSVPNSDEVDRAYTYEREQKFSRVEMQREIVSLYGSTLALRRNLREARDRNRELQQEQDNRDEHDIACRISCTTLDPLEKPLEDMSTDELKEAMEYAESCKCVQCYFNRFTLSLKSRAEAAEAELSHKKIEMQVEREASDARVIALLNHSYER
jgi:hypothetical protein